MNGNVDNIKLIQETLAGNEDSFNKLVESVRPLSKFYAMSIARDEYIANEAAQLSIIKMYQSLSSLKDPELFEGWYKRIIRNTTLDLLKKENREINFSSFDQNEDDNFEYSIADERIDYQPELKFAQDEKEKMILDIISALPDNQRTPIMMYFYENMKIREIAEELSIPESTVKTRLTAGKNNIKTRVEQIQKKDGIKLYNISPLGFFIWLLKGYAPSAVSVGITGTALLGTAAAVGVSSKSTLIGKLGRSLVVRILAGMTALTAVTGGGYALIRNVLKEDTKEPEVQEVIEVIKEEEPKEEMTYNVNYVFTGKNGISLPLKVMAKLPPTLSDQPSGTNISVSSFDNIKVGNYIFHFEGWDKNEYTITDSDVTFTGTWSRSEQVIKYNVYYQFVSRNGETMPDSIYEFLPATASYNKGETVSAPYISNDIKGWTFKGWDHDSITLENGDVTFTGTWKKESETIKTDPEHVVEPTSEPEEEVEMKNIDILFYAKKSDGGGWGELPDDVLYYFPKEYHHQIIPVDAEPVLPSIEIGTVCNGWRFDGSIGGVGWKDNYDMSYWYQWSKIED